VRFVHHLLSLPVLAALGGHAAFAQTTGAELYDAACAACHGSDGAGKTQSELAFAVPVPDFTDCDFAAREPDSDWGAIIHRGGPIRGFDPLMPAFGEALSEADVEQILAHVRGMCVDERWPRGELNMPRALFTEKAYPEDEAVITTTMATEGLDSISHEFLWEQRFGPLNQMEIKIPIARADLGDPGGWQSGAGDLAIGVKHTLRHSARRGSILSIGGELVLPTGDETRGFGSGSTVFESFILYGKLLPNDSFVQLQGILEFPTDSAFDDELVVRGAFGRTWTADRPFGRAWTPMVEVLGARALDGGSTQWDVVPQFQVTLNTRQHVMAAAGLRVPVTDRGPRTTEFVVYLLWDWFDGGVLEGW